MKIIQIEAVEIGGSINLYALSEDGRLFLRRSGSVPNPDEWIEIDTPDDMSGLKQKVKVLG